MRRKLTRQGYAERKCPRYQPLSEQDILNLGDPCALLVRSMSQILLAQLSSSYKAAKNNSFNCCIWEAVRATSAAPTFFERIAIGPEGSQIEYVDAGLGYNNPIKQVIDEAERVFGKKAPVACIVSIGTGQAGSVKYAQPSTFQNLLPTELIGVLVKMASDSKRIAKEMEKRYRDMPGIYARLDVARGLSGITLDEWKRFGEVEHHTKRYMQLEHVDKRVDGIVNAPRGLFPETREVGDLGS